MMAKRRMRFVTWAKKDPTDETKIVYTFKTFDRGVLHFTSEDYIWGGMLGRVQNAWIESIERISDETGTYWNAVIYEEGYYQ